MRTAEIMSLASLHERKIKITNTNWPKITRFNLNAVLLEKRNKKVDYVQIIFLPDLQQK